MNAKSFFFGAVAATSLLVGNNAAHAVIVDPGGPSSCFQCKLSPIYGEISGECQVRCKDCCEPECVNMLKECTGTIQPVIKCAAGEYGRTSSTCNICPSDAITHANTTSDEGENLFITGCYIPSGASFYDDSGAGTYDGNCYYES